MSPNQNCQHAYRPINVTTVKMITQHVQESRGICYYTQNIKPKLHNLQFTDLSVNLICGSKKSELHVNLQPNLH
jgi:4-hydroxy-3-methylbut-2-enyl diphosphate reductase IspH